MTSDSQQLTIETRLPRALPAPQAQALDAYAALFSKCVRHFVSQTNRGQAGSAPPIRKPEFMLEHGITARQFNAVKSTAEGMMESRRSNLPNYIAQCEHKIAGLEVRLAKKLREIAAVQSTADATHLSTLYRAAAGFRRRISIQAGRRARFKTEQKRKLSPICFGSKRLYRSQFELERNGYGSHADWQSDWRAARSAQFFVKGSSDEAGGCQGCTLMHGDDGKWLLRVRLPAVLAKQYGTHLLIEAVEFNYRPELPEQALARQAVRNEKLVEYRKEKRAGTLPKELDGTPVKEATYLAGLGQPLSYRFLRDDRGWRVLVSTSERFETEPADFSRGAIGVDFNAGFVSVAELDATGHKTNLTDITYAEHEATSPQNATALQAVAKVIATQAREAGKPIVIESLDFKRKKAALQKGQQGQSDYHAMLSSLSYAAFRHALRMQCLRQGVALVTVNPAYTSLLGQIKYSRETNYNSHQAAAWVIARRGMGLAERIPRKSLVSVRLHRETYTAPVDTRAGTFSDLKELQSHFKAWMIKQQARTRAGTRPVPALVPPQALAA